VVTAGFAGTVIVAVCVLFPLSPEVAVITTDCAAAVAAGAVKVAEPVLVFDSVPATLDDQVTPAGSALPPWVRVPTRTAVSPPSTVDGALIVITSVPPPLPPNIPQPVKEKADKDTKPARSRRFLSKGGLRVYHQQNELKMPDRNESGRSFGKLLKTNMEQIKWRSSSTLQGAARHCQ
jgi:hypothetical protein